LVFVTSIVDDPRSALSRLAVAEDHADEQVAGVGEAPQGPAHRLDHLEVPAGKRAGCPSSLVSIVSIRTWERSLSV
jgi:hypothetical protein